jgi:hypothetical protein
MPVKTFTINKDYCPICDAEVKGGKMVKVADDINVTINDKKVLLAEKDTYHRHCLKNFISDAITTAE